jgi:hypothetical protein
MALGMEWCRQQGYHPELITLCPKKLVRPWHEIGVCTIEGKMYVFDNTSVTETGNVDSYLKEYHPDMIRLPPRRN